jgi:ATP-dependent Clp protease adapter protein ClpS
MTSLEQTVRTACPPSIRSDVLVLRAEHSDEYLPMSYVRNIQTNTSPFYDRVLQVFCARR